jgi:hypothetical protein
MEDKLIRSAHPGSLGVVPRDASFRFGANRALQFLMISNSKASRLSLMDSIVAANVASRSIMGRSISRPSLTMSVMKGQDCGDTLSPPMVKSFAFWVVVAGRFAFSHTRFSASYALQLLTVATRLSIHLRSKGRAQVYREAGLKIPLNRIVRRHRNAENANLANKR